ncbi:MAG: ATP-binding cassette domain-containing protein [Xanthobacteraceae bacterium]
MVRELIAGNNFSGRSETLRSALQRRQEPAFFLGPYAEAALSGLSSTVADEIAIYARAPQHGCFASIDWTRLGNRKPATLSGGEQVSLALHCFSRSAYRLIGIDTALEQLDAQNRASALAYLSAPHSFDAILIDNRLAHVPPGWRRQDAHATTADYGCDLAGLLTELRPREAPAITIRAMDFSYEPARPIFRDVDLSLKPGKAYRLVGPNGAGKSTFFKILVGVLAPARGTILLNDMPYRPRRSGNRVFALATQNPDHQWCGATLAEDIARRRRALAACSEVMPPSDALLAAMARKLGIRSLDQLLYELPLAARKRLSWLWPFSGAMSWLMLDEPTIGQDRDTRTGLAAIVSRLCQLGYGTIVVTHDDEFAASIPHQPLHIEDMTIRAV